MTRRKYGPGTVGRNLHPLRPRRRLSMRPVPLASAFSPTPSDGSRIASSASRANSCGDRSPLHTNPAGSAKASSQKRATATA